MYFYHSLAPDKRAKAIITNFSRLPRFFRFFLFASRFISPMPIAPLSSAARNAAVLRISRRAKNLLLLYVFIYTHIWKQIYLLYPIATEVSTKKEQKSLGKLCFSPYFYKIFPCDRSGNRLVEANRLPGNKQTQPSAGIYPPEVQ